MKRVPKEPKDVKSQGDAPKAQEQFVTVEQFNKLESSVADGFKAITDALLRREEKPAADKSSEASAEKDARPEVGHVPPAWREIVNEVLGPDFGINVVYPDKGSGFLFKVIVPPSKSNAPKDYLEFYKADVRTRAIGYGEGVDGVRRHCEKIKKNLVGTKKNNL